MFVINYTKYINPCTCAMYTRRRGLGNASSYQFYAKLTSGNSFNKKSRQQVVAIAIRNIVTLQRYNL